MWGGGGGGADGGKDDEGPHTELYECLGVPVDADSATIKKAYFMLAKKVWGGFSVCGRRRALAPLAAHYAGITMGSAGCRSTQIRVATLRSSRPQQQRMRAQARASEAV